MKGIIILYIIFWIFIICEFVWFSKEVPEESKKEDIVTTVKTENKERELTPKEKFEAKLEEIYGKDMIVLPKKEENKVTSELKLEEENPYIFGHYQPQPLVQTKSTSNSPTLPDLMDLCKKNKIELHPVPITFRRNHKANLKKAFTCVKKKDSNDKKAKLTKIDTKGISNYIKF